MLDLTTIRERNKGQPEGYWKTTTAALCDEVERLRQPPASSPDIDAIRRMDGHVPPWIVRMLCDRVEKAERDAASFQRLATHTEARRLVDKIGYEMLRDAAFAWADAIDRCNGIVTAEEALRDVVRELRGL